MSHHGEDLDYLPWYPKFFPVRVVAERNRLAKEFVELRRQGLSGDQIGRKHGVSRSWVHRVMKHACPPFVPPAKPSKKQPPVGRAEWTKPGAELLRIAREGRNEIAAAEAYLRVIRRRPSLAITASAK